MDAEIVIEAHTFWWYVIGTLSIACLIGMAHYFIKEAIYCGIKKYFNKE